MTYFSEYEGFGNAFVEAVLARKPIFVNNYQPVYWPDIGSKGFRTVQIENGELSDEAVAEAQRCIQCKARPCVAGCPVAVRIPEFLGAIAEGDFATAADILLRDNALPATTGRVCPQEVQCEQVCVRGKKGEPVAIGWLERFVADWAAANAAPPTPPPPPASARAGATCRSEWRTSTLPSTEAPPAAATFPRCRCRWLARAMRVGGE